MSARTKIIAVFASTLLLGGMAMTSLVLQQRREAEREEKLKAMIQKITREIVNEHYGKKKAECSQPPRN